MDRQTKNGKFTFVPEHAPIVHALYQGSTGRWQYIVADSTSKHAIIINPLLDQTLTSGKILTTAADEALVIVRQHKYIVDRILETHHPTYHASSAWYLRTQIMEATGNAPRVNIEKSIAGVQRLFRRKYGSDASTWAYDFDQSYEDGETLRVGKMSVMVLRLLNQRTEERQFGFLIGKNIFAGGLDAAMDLPNKRMGIIDDPSNYCVYTSEVSEATIR